MSPNASCSDEEFIALWAKFKGNASNMARELGMSGPRPVLSRRKLIELRHGVVLTATHKTHNEQVVQKIHRKARQETTIKNGVVLIASDCHYWPGEPTTAHRGFLRFCREMKPKIVVLNGDVFDGASISRWERIGWDSRPTVKQELDVCDERLREVEIATRGAERYWPMGNHDARYETFLAKHAPQYEGVKFTSLKDRYPKWKPCWSLFINEDVVIKHRFKGGIHSTHNATVWAGRTMINGHLHSLKVTPFSDLNGTRYGVDTGTLAEPYGDQFVDYTEDAPKNWRSGFVVLTFHEGRLLWPEVVHVISDGKVEFRGQVIDV